MIKSSAARTPHSRALAMPRALPTRTLLRCAAFALVAIAGSLALRNANAAAGLCTSGAQCSAEQNMADKDKQLGALTAALQDASLGYSAQTQLGLSDQEFFSF